MTRVTRSNWMGGSIVWVKLIHGWPYDPENPTNWPLTAEKKLHNTSTIKFSLIWHHGWYCVFYSYMYVPITVISTRLPESSDSIIKLYTLKMTRAKCGANWPSGFREDVNILIWSNWLYFYSKQKIIKMTHFKEKLDILIRTKHQLSAFYYK